MLQCDYDMLLAPQIIGDSMIAVSVPSKSRIDQGMLLIKVPMETFEQEVSNRGPGAQIVKIADLIKQAEKLKGVLND